MIKTIILTGRQIIQLANSAGFDLASEPEPESEDLYNKAMAILQDWKGRTFFVDEDHNFYHLAEREDFRQPSEEKTMSTTYLNVQLDKDLKCRCDNCGWKGKAKKLKPISDIEDRIYPGEEVPAGECPACGACAFIIPKRTEAQRILRKWHKQVVMGEPYTAVQMEELLDDLHTLIV